MTAYTVALVNPSGDIEAWLRRDLLMTPARWEAGRFDHDEAKCLAVSHNRRDRAIRDDRMWRAVLADVAEMAS